MLPELLLKQTLAKYKSEATLFKGMKGMETAFDDVFKTLKKGDIVHVFVVGKLDERINNFFKYHYEKRAKKGIITKTIYSALGRGHYESREYIKYNEGKVLAGAITSAATVNVYGEKVILRIGDWKEVICVMINNKSLADSFLEQFNMMWNQRVQTFEGQDAVETAYNTVLHDVKPKDDLIVFAAKPPSKRASDFNLNWVKKINEKIDDVRAIYYGATETNIKRTKEFEAQGCKTKIIPTKQSLPISTVVSGSNILGVVWSKNPFTFLFNDKTIADSYRENFKLLWDQDVVLEKGIEAIQNAWDQMLDELKPEEEYYVMGAADRGNEELNKWLVDFHKRRQTKGVKSKFLFVSGAEKFVEKYKANYAALTEFKYLPEGVYKGIQFNFFKDKVLIIVWRKREPVVFTIQDKEVYQTFKTYFDALWDQEAFIYRGYDVLQDIFEETLKHKEVKLIGARGYFFDKRPEYLEEYTRKAQKSGTKWRNVVDIEAADHPLLKTPFIKNKFFPSEFRSPNVIWMFGNKLVNTNWTRDEPVIFITENKEIVEGYSKYFELLWNQDVNVYKGFDEVTNKFWSMLDDYKPGEEYHVLGATYAGVDKNMKEWFHKYHTYRVKRGVHVKLLSTTESYEGVMKVLSTTGDPKMKTGAVKKLPEELSSPMQINLYKGNKVLMLLWGKEMTCFVIESEVLYQNFKNYFDMLWKTTN
jgi:hypothetical protein